MAGGDAHDVSGTSTQSDHTPPAAARGLDRTATPPGGPSAAPAPGDPGDRVERLITAIGTLSRTIDRYRNAFGADRGLSGTEVVALIHLFQEQTATAGELAARTGLTRGAVTALLDRLERRGYLTRVRPPANRRTLRIELTAQGWALRSAAFDPIESLLRATTPDALDLEAVANGLDQTAHLIESAHQATTRSTDANTARSTSSTT